MNPLDVRASIDSDEILRHNESRGWIDPIEYM